LTDIKIILQHGGTNMRQGKIIDEHGDTRYYKDDQLHRDDDLPASVWAGGDKLWYQNGKQHRLAGPAIEYANGSNLYCIDGKWLTKKQHANHPEVKKYKLQQALNRLTA
jgi:hypothetical protein